jgi:hypothetical protein
MDTVGADDDRAFFHGAILAVYAHTVRQDFNVGYALLDSNSSLCRIGEAAVKSVNELRS